jgi:hypothetical protein
MSEYFEGNDNCVFQVLLKLVAEKRDGKEKFLFMLSNYNSRHLGFSSHFHGNIF